MIWIALLLGLAGTARAAGDDAQACLTCHPAPGLRQRLSARGAPMNPTEELTRFFGSAHSGFSCQTCHPGTTVGPHGSKPETTGCLDCHRMPLPGRSSFGAELVDQLHTRKSQNSPQCVSCHGKHGVARRDDPAASIYWRRVPDLCTYCHASAVAPAGIPQVEYPKSIHSRVIHQAGEERRAVVCTDCHSVHAPPGTPGMSIPAKRGAMPQTCGRCHREQAKLYLASAHGMALARGVQGAPVCTDCHTEHAILPPWDPRSSVSPQGIIKTCSKCHGNADFVRLHGLPRQVVPAYLNSYHGKANRYGDVRVANCASCHTAHSMLPAKDPRSSVNPANLPKTCGRCHAGAGTTFRIGRVHVMPSVTHDRILFWLRTLYQVFVGFTILSFFGYIALDTLTHRRLTAAGVEAELEERISALPAPPQSALLRMVRAERIQHVALLASFAVLALTGFALLFPNSMFSRVVVYLCGGMQGRALVHRVAAVGLIGSTLGHFAWVFTTSRGRETFRRLLPGLTDVREVWQTALLFLGLSTQRPCFYRYSFLEKFEYWALMWGTVVMSVTGVLLVVMDWSLAHMPKFILDVADIIHTWEAILAVVAIAVWHLYHVLWKPGVFPGNRSWLQGEMTVEQYVREHPLDYAEAMGWIPPQTGLLTRRRGGSASGGDDKEETSE